MDNIEILQKIPEKFRKRMSLISSGDEGTVYKFDGKYRPYAIKIYRAGLQKYKMEREFDFLKRYRKTGAVPSVYSLKKDLNNFQIIAMDYLDGYTTLYSFYSRKKDFSEKQQDDLLKKLIVARLKIGYDQEYTDLHWKNIMVKVTPSVVDVKMIDPGERIDHNGADVWLSHIKDIVDRMRWGRLPTAKLVKKGNVKKIKEYVE